MHSSMCWMFFAFLIYRWCKIWINSARKKQLRWFSTTTMIVIKHYLRLWMLSFIHERMVNLDRQLYITFVAAIYFDVFNDIYKSRYMYIMQLAMRSHLISVIYHRINKNLENGFSFIKVLIEVSTQYRLLVIRI